MASRLYTLLVLDAGAQLLDPEGILVKELGTPASPEPDVQRTALAGLLPPKAELQLIFAHSRLAIHCQDVPRLTRREQAEVRRRTVAMAENPVPILSGHVLEVDPLAEGGHVLWVASLPQEEMDAWLADLKEANVRAVFAMAWPRAFLGEGKGLEDTARVVLTLAPGAGHLLFFRGRSLTYLRVFTLPADLDPAGRSGQEELGHVAMEELSRLLQFIQQKNRGSVPATLFTVGVPEAGVPALEAMGRMLGLTLESLGPDLAAFLLAGAQRERGRTTGLDLLPEESRVARKIRVRRALVWTAALGLMVIAPGTRVLLGGLETTMEQEVTRAEGARDRRRAQAQEGEEAARARFGYLRFRSTEERQGLRLERLERLGLRIFQVPEGIVLKKVEIRAGQGTEAGHRFMVEGEGLTRRDFSLENLVTYYRHLASLPGLRLEPLSEVKVVDGSLAGAGTEQAVARFRLEGSAP